LKYRETLKDQERPTDHETKRASKSHEISEFFNTFTTVGKRGEEIPLRVTKNLVDLAKAIPAGEQAVAFLTTFKTNYDDVRSFWSTLGPPSLSSGDNAALIGRLFKIPYPDDTLAAISRRIVSAIIFEKVEPKQTCCEAPKPYHLRKDKHIKNWPSVPSQGCSGGKQGPQLAEKKRRKLGRIYRFGKRLRMVSRGLYVGLQGVGHTMM
jgi:hypothetical protein